MQTDLYLVRHGETAWNAESRFQGHQDSPLTATGIAHAEGAAEVLRHVPLTALYASDLPRTIQTAQPIAKMMGLPIQQEPALRERNLGIFEGLTRAQVQADYADDFARYHARDAEFVIPNGESLQQLQQRSAGIMETIVRRHPGQAVVIVSHGAFLTTFLRYIHGIPLDSQGHSTVPNGSVSHVRFDFENDTWQVISEGQVAPTVAEARPGAPVRSHGRKHWLGGVRPKRQR